MIYKKSNSIGVLMIDLCMKILDLSNLAHKMKSSYKEIFQLLKHILVIMSYEVLSAVYLLIDECKKKKQSYHYQN